jgi:lipopolysaccharide biosynthesis regulator YciM
MKRQKTKENKMSHTMNEVYKLINTGDYQQAITELEILEKGLVLNPNILVLKGICLQLTDEDSRYSLSDVEEMFKEAYRIDRECLEAIVELAWFNLNINDDAQTAIKLFEQVFESYREKMTEIVIGVAQCMVETKSPQESINYLEKISVDVVDKNKIESLKKEIMES